MSGGSGAWLAWAVLALSGAAPGVTPVRVTSERREVLTNARVVAVRDRLLVPLRAVTDALEGQLRWEAATMTAVVQYRGGRLAVNGRTHAMSLDGKPFTAPVRPVMVRGQLLVPLDVVERLFGVRGRWQPQGRRLSFAAAGGSPNKPRAASGLALMLSVDHKTYPVGTPVRLNLAVTNAGPAPVTLQFSSGQKYDFEVRRGGQTVWRWSADRMFTQALTSLALAAGARQTFTETWKQQDNHGQPIPAGDYEAIATLTTMTRPQPQSARIAFRIGS